MKKVNPYYIHALLAPLTGLADDESSVRDFSIIDSDNEHQMKQVIRLYLKPYFIRFDDQSKEICKLSLQYYLTKTDSDFGRIYDSCLLPFDPPSESRLFFKWLWEELFDDENFWLENIGEFIENKDIHAPTLIKLDESSKAG